MSKRALIILKETAIIAAICLFVASITTLARIGTEQNKRKQNFVNEICSLSGAQSYNKKLDDLCIDIQDILDKEYIVEHK